MPSFGNWLAEIGLGRYDAVFASSEIDFDVIRSLSDTDLRELGLALGDRKRLLQAIIRLDERPPADSVAAAAGSGPLREDAFSHGGERRQLTVMFCDLVGSTALSEKLDPEELRSVLHAYRVHCGEVIARYDGFVARYVGDGILTYFGWPTAHEEDAERAVRAALEIVDTVKLASSSEALSVRIGIATGPVVVGETAGVGDQSKLAVGSTPNLASRLQGLATADQIVIAASTRRLVGNGFELTDLGEHDLKGIAEPVHAWRVERVSVTESRFEAHRGGALTPLVGREEELDLLLRRWSQARDGEGQVVLLSGEPGIGKSRILSALRERLQAQRVQALRFHCSPYYVNSALWPVIDNLVRALKFTRDEAADAKLDKLEALVVTRFGRPLADVRFIASILSIPCEQRYGMLPMTPQKHKAETLRTLVNLIEAAARRQPSVMLFEDAHWADPTTLDLLDLLIDRLTKLPFLLVITFRAEFTAPWVGRAGASLIALSRLNRRHSEVLAAQVVTDRVLTRELLEQIVTQTDGVPLFIEELTKAVLETSADPNAAELPLTVPGTLQASLMARLDRLPAAKQVAQLGAVIGREFPHALLAATASLPETQLARGLDELIASGLVSRRGVSSDAVYTFNHALTRDVAYASLLKSRRLICHQRVAVALEEFDDGFVRATKPELLAFHFQEAGNLSSALKYLIAAGDVEEQHGASQEALVHYRSAKQLTEREDLSAADRARTPELLMKLANTQTQMDGYHSEEVSQWYMKARDAALALGQEDEAAAAGVRMAPFLLGSCRLHDVIEIGNKILRGNPERLRPETLVHVWVMMAGASCHAGEFQQSLAFSEKAIELDDVVKCTHKAPWAAADPAIVARDYVEMVSRLTGHFERSLAVSDQSMALAVDRGHSFSIVWASVSRVFALGAFGRYAEAVECADHAVKICERHGFDARIGNVLLHRGPVLFELGDEERGLADLQRGVALWRKTSGTFMLARNMMMLADYQLRAKHLEQARISLGEAECLAETTEEKDYLAEIIRLRGRICQSEGHYGQARCCFQRAIARSRDQRARLFELQAARDLVRLCGEAGGLTEALEILRKVVDWFPPRLDIPVLAECRALLQ
jgi:class 3 adenylate cyclase/tetratricopeptide (TPR) repeat protein